MSETNTAAARRADRRRLQGLSSRDARRSAVPDSPVPRSRSPGEALTFLLDTNILSDLRREARPRAALLNWFADQSPDALYLSADRVLPIDRQVADEWGRLRAIRTLPVVDALLAATARVHNLTLVTRNDKHFADLNVTILNPR